MSPPTKPEDNRPGADTAVLAQRLLEQVEAMAVSLARIADALAPPPPDLVGTPYVAKRLGCTTVWVAEMVRLAQLPRHCIVPGTGKGKPWKFYRGKIDEWLASR